MKLGQEILLGLQVDEILAKVASALIEGHSFQQVHIALFDRPYDEEQAAQAPVVRQATLALSQVESSLSTSPSAQARKGPSKPLTLPLTCRDRWLGRITLSPLPERPSLAHEELRYLQALAGLAGLAVEQAQQRRRLEELSIRDELTGCYNRRYFEEALKREVSWAKRYDRILSLLILDIDGLKACNDRYGHLAGDQVLRAFGGVLIENTRRSDVACRYGGDEFAVILPETGHTQALTAARRLLKRVERHPFKVGRRRLRITARFGIGTFPQDGSSPEALIAAADRACYRAKASR